MLIRRVVSAAALPAILVISVAAWAQQPGGASLAPKPVAQNPAAPTQALAQAQTQRQSNPATVAELKAMLRQFLADASTENAAGFDRFFADDVLYTRAAGAIVPKRLIMRSVNNAEQSADSKVTYSAEGIVVHDYGDTAVIAFRLVEHNALGAGRFEEANYRNTGTFLRRNGQWQVIAWQSTRILERVAGR
jgi:ketosteroid isomerase-like protein